MPIVLVDALALLAFALVAIVIFDAVRMFVVTPMRTASGAVSGVPVIGGTLAWVLWKIAEQIDLGLSAAAWMIAQGKADALSTWQWLVSTTVGWQFSGFFWWVQQLALAWNSIAWVTSHWNQLWGQAYSALPSWISAVSNDLSGLHWWIDHVQLPLIGGIGDDLAGLHRWIDTVELPFIRGIADDLGALHRWIDANLARRSEVAQAEARALAGAAAIAVPIAAAVNAIQQSRCFKVCDPLGGVGELLQGLEDAGMLAIILGMIEETRRDPQGVQSILRSVVVPIVHDAASSVGLGD